jgi:S-DNA-T family DNA segregation ATPase FtsK/SpoIIIE
VSDDAGDELYEEAKEAVLQAGKASASLLQRRLRVGYARAARLLDILEEQGVVGPGDGAKPREVYGVSDKERAEFGGEPQDYE